MNPHPGSRGRAGRGWFRSFIAALTLPSTPGISRLVTSLQLSHQRQNELTFGYTTLGVLLSASTTAFRPVTPRLDFGVETADQEIFNQDALDAYLLSHDDLRLRRLLRVPRGESAVGIVGSSIVMPRGRKGRRHRITVVLGSPSPMRRLLRTGMGLAGC